MTLITTNLLSEGCRCGLDMKLGWMDSTWMYIPFSLMIERPQMRPYHNKLLAEPTIQLPPRRLLAVHKNTYTINLRCNPSSKDKGGIED